MKNKIKIVLLALCFFAGFLTSGHCALKEDWKEFRSYHFIIYYKDVPLDFVKSVEESAENDYQEITRNLGYTRYDSWSWDKRAKIYIYSDGEDYVTSAKQAGWSHGVADWLAKEIRTYPSAAGFFDSLLPHEMGHIIFREFIGSNPYVPLWMDEGVAMYQEKAKRWGVNKEVKKAIDTGRFIPLSDLSTIRLYNNTDPELVNLFYTEAASIVYYLITELGEYKFVDLCKELKDGSRFEKAIKSTYMRFKDLNDLNEAWMDYLRK